MSTLHIFRGVPASGKTTAAREWLAEGENRIRVNRDDIRFNNFGKYWGVNEIHVTEFEDDAIRRAMKLGLDIVLDSTNLVRKHVIDKMEIAQAHGYEVEFTDFTVSFNEALDRDEGRDKAVGEDVLRSFFRRFIGKDGVSLPTVPTIQPTPLFEPYVEVGDLP